MTTLPMRRVSSFERMAELQAECLADDIPVAAHMLSWTEQQALYYFESGGQPPAEQLYPRVWLTSDVHSDREENMRWVRSLPQHGSDALVVAGDVSHNMEQLEATLRAFSEKFEHVFFTAGNHDLWISRADGPMDSLTKLDAIDRLCQRLGNVYTSPKLLRANGSTSGEGAGLWVVPLVSWYDDSLDLAHIAPHVAHRSGDMRSFTWSDFALCKWPASLLRPGDTITGLYPSGVAASLAQLNEPAVAEVNAALRGGVGDALFSFSHFLPREETLPDWLEPSAAHFSADWLSHPAGSTAVKFSKVAGSRLIDQQLRRLAAGARWPTQEAAHPAEGMKAGAAQAAPLPMGCRHTHAFGHSHRPKDFTLDGVRYVSHPLGYSKERANVLTPAEPHLKLVWDVHGPAPLPDRPLVRYWEEHGGREPRLDAMLAPLRAPAAGNPHTAADVGVRGGVGRTRMRRNMTWTCGTEFATMDSAAECLSASHLCDSQPGVCGPPLGAAPHLSSAPPFPLTVRGERRRQLMMMQRQRAAGQAAIQQQWSGAESPLPDAIAGVLAVAARTRSLGAFPGNGMASQDNDDLGPLL